MRRSMMRSFATIGWLALLTLPATAGVHASSDESNPAKTCGGDSVCQCNADAEPSDFDRAISNALRGQSVALTEIAPESKDESAELWRIGTRLERVALRIIEARSAFLGASACGSPGIRFDVAVELMAEASREGKSIDGIVADDTSNLSPQARTRLREITAALRRDLDVEPSLLGNTIACTFSPHPMTDTGGPACSSGSCGFGLVCKKHPSKAGCLCSVKCP